jgi:hypothetical protein
MSSGPLTTRQPNGAPIDWNYANTQGVCDVRLCPSQHQGEQGACPSFGLPAVVLTPRPDGGKGLDSPQKKQEWMYVLLRWPLLVSMRALHPPSSAPRRLS